MRPKPNPTNYHDLLLLLIPTFILIVAWIGFTIYGSRVQSTISEMQTKRIEPISPTFDFETVSSLKTRDTISPLFTFQAPLSLEEGTPIASDSSLLAPPAEDIPEAVPAETQIPASNSATTAPSTQTGGML